MEEALWAYMTIYRTPTQETPYSLVYGVEAVLPLERQIPLLWLAIQEGLTDEENSWSRLEELETLDEKRLEAQQSFEYYQARLSRYFKKRVRLRSFQVGDQVLVVKRPIITSRRSGGKFFAKWDGPYIVQEVYSSGTYNIVDSEGLRIGPINGKFMKRYCLEENKYAPYRTSINCILLLAYKSINCARPEKKIARLKTSKEAAKAKVRIFKKTHSFLAMT
ncbi:uncharacterized protein [Nicotiana sylvestris]|uniref:uncharacterized protein n=1 Tax=Nicotiana sylvestris TaxID=4096 RepID=UPI00388C5AEB